MWKLWWKSSSSQTKKQKQMLEAFFCQKIHQEPTDYNRMVTVDTVKKSWKNAVVAKYAANGLLTYDRSGKHAINF